MFYICADNLRSVLVCSAVFVTPFVTSHKEDDQSNAFRSEVGLMRVGIRVHFNWVGNEVLFLCLPNGFRE
jgi:hypothetical protein